MTKKILHVTSPCGDKRGLVIRPGIYLAADLTQLGIEYHVIEDKDNKDFYVVVNGEEELILKLKYGALEWIPYGTFKYGY